MKTITSWLTTTRPKRGERLQHANHFDARGMRRVYGHTDRFGRGLTFHIAVWLTRDKRILARFWAHRDEVDWLSLEILGFSHPPLIRSEHRVDQPPGSDEEWVPQCLRDEYESWVLSEWPTNPP